MAAHNRCLLLILTISALVNTAIAASPTSFCKCTCFTNSTIIPLDAPPPSGPQSRSAFLFSRDTENGDDGEDDDDGAEKEGSGDPPPATDEDESKGKGDDDEEDKKEYRAGNCNDCNRQFCLDYNLPICKKASMEDVFTTCFQRDSRKDEAVVFIFIIATVGLLVWAGVKPWVAKWVDNARERRSYVPVLGDDT